MKLRVCLAISLVSLLCSVHAPAMSIYLFVKMKSPDQATYIDNMVEGAAKILKDQGHPDQAKKLMDLFYDSSKQGGVNQFVTNLKAVDAENRKNAINPNNRKDVLQVEDAMSRTLKDNGIIILAKQLLPINQTFMPAPPKILFNPEDGPPSGVK